MTSLFVYLTVVGLVATVLALGSRRLRELPMSDPLAALLAGVIVGPQVLALVDVPAPTDVAVIEIVTVLLLAVSLMDIALRYPLAEIRGHAGVVALLLLVILPVMAMVSAALSAWLLGLSAAVAGLLGATLAPTDPVLASSVVIGEPAERDLPSRLRQILSVEAGANDVVALPFVTLGIALGLDEALWSWALSTLWDLAGGVSIGVVVGAAAGRVVGLQKERGELETSAFLFFTVLLALFTLGLAEIAHANGLLAVFVAGLAYNTVISGPARTREESIEEGVNRFAIIPVFAMFGVALPWAAWGRLGWVVVAFAVAVLVLRRLPALLALRRPLELSTANAAFAGWFGPIGIAALYYLSRAAGEGALNGDGWAAGTLVVAASTLSHGLSSDPGRRLYVRARRDADGG